MPCRLSFLSLCTDSQPLYLSPSTWYGPSAKKKFAHMWANWPFGSTGVCCDIVGWEGVQFVHSLHPALASTIYCAIPGQNKDFLALV